ncbi:MAG: 23S rRNA (adenine(2503)-C(2))-methyltransferase RlmN [candidate division WOR-3 bacterium]
MSYSDLPRENIVALGPHRIMAICKELDWQPYRVVQILKWLWQKGAESFEEMTNISQDCRRLLASRFSIDRLNVISAQRASDGTTKFHLKLRDGIGIESVLIPDGGRFTVCVSTQAGCPLQCSFCRSGRTHFIRNLYWYEIVDQVVAVTKTTNRRPTNVVFMGMGEPFLNYEQVIIALSVLNADYGLKIGARHLTVSTAGIPHRIRAYAHIPLQARLAVSLNAADQLTRSKLMPISHRYPLKQVLDAVRQFVSITRRRVTFEYVLIEGINDRPHDALSLRKILSGMPCKVNLIPLNPLPGSRLRAPTPERIRQFADFLYPSMSTVTIRRSRGISVSAGCGQLAATTLP